MGNYEFLLKHLEHGLWSLCDLQPPPKEKVNWYFDPNDGALVIQWR